MAGCCDICVQTKTVAVLEGIMVVMETLCYYVAVYHERLGDTNRYCSDILLCYVIQNKPIGTEIGIKIGAHILDISLHRYSCHGFLLAQL